MLEALPPLEQAKVALAQRKFDQARKSLGEMLKKNPNSPEIILLLGQLNDHSCANRPEGA